MKSFPVILVPLAVFAFSGCPEDPPDGFNPNVYSFDTCTMESSGDVSEAYLDLVQGMDIDINGDTLTVVIALLDIPDSELLVFEHTNLGTARLEYEWAANFDVDGDGFEDYKLALSHYKTGLAEQTGDIDGFTQSSLWEINGITGTKIADATLAIVSDSSPDSFTLEVTNPIVGGLPVDLGAFFTTFLDNGINQFKDSCRN